MQNTKIGFVSGAVAVLSLWILLWLKTGEYKSEIASWKSLNESNAKIWRNADSTSQASIRDAFVTIDVLKATHQRELQAANEKIKGLKKDLSNLQSFTTIGTSTSGTIITVVDTVTIDSSGVKIEKPGFAYSDEWVTLRGYFLRKDLASDNSIHIDYSIRDSISVAQYWEKPPGFFGFLKPSVLRTDVISENPNSEIRTLRSTSIRERPKRLSLVAVGGYGLYPNGVGPFIGVGLGYSLIKF